MAYFNSMRKVVATAMLVAVAAIVVLYAFRNWTKEAADAELLLAQIRAELRALSILEWQAISKGTVDAGMEEEVAEIQQRVDTLRRAIKEPDDRINEFDDMYRGFGLAIDQEYALIKAKKLDEAKDYDESVIDPLFDKLDARIAEISAEMAAKKERIGAIADVGIALSLLTAALIIAAMFSFFTRIRDREAQKLNETRELAAFQERGKEQERKRIARDIHDELGQNLMALRLDMVRMMANPSLKPSTTELAASVLSQIDMTIRSVRTIINNLRPPALDLGLHAAIEWQAKEFERHSGIACEVHIDHPEFALDDQRATGLFRSVQESLSNVIRHAKASRVRINMHLKDGQLHMKIADDGVGYDPNAGRKENAFGLIGIAERMHALGGTFSTTSHPEQGMTVNLSIPV